MSNQAPPTEAHYCIRCGNPLVIRHGDGRDRQVCSNCGWVYYPRANQAAAVAVLQDGNVLMVRRKYDPFKGQWSLPSGFLEYDESPEETAVRELREELGVEVELTGLADVQMERSDPRGLCLLVVYIGRIVGGQPRPGDDASELRSFPLDHLPPDIAFDSHRKALRQIHPLRRK